MNVYNTLPRNLRILSILLGLLIFIFLLGISSVNTFQGVAQVNKITGILIIIFSIPFFQRFFSIPLEAALYGGFILWAIITGVIVSEDQALLWNNASTLIQLFAIFLTIINLEWVFKEVNINFRIFVFITLILAVYGIATRNYVDVLSGGLNERVSSLMYNPNDFGVLMCLGSASVLFFWEKGSRIQRLLFVALIGVFCAAIILSGSRKAFLAFLLLIGAWLWFCYRKIIKDRPITLVLIIAVLLGGWLLTNYVVGNTFLGVRLSLLWQNPNTNQVRLSLYQDAADLFLSHPVAGIGLGNFALFSPTGMYAHSDYGEVLADTGLFGAIFYFSMYLVFWLRLNRLDRVVSEPNTLYAFRLFKAIIIMLLFIGLGQPNYDGVFKMFVLASMIGYTIIKERQIRNNNVSPPFKSRFS